MTPAELEELFGGERAHDDAVILARQRAYWLASAANPDAGTNGRKTRRQCLLLARRLERLIVCRAICVEVNTLRVIAMHQVSA